MCRYMGGWTEDDYWSASADFLDEVLENMQWDSHFSGLSAEKRQSERDRKQA